MYHGPAPSLWMAPMNGANATYATATRRCIVLSAATSRRTDPERLFEKRLTCLFPTFGTVIESYSLRSRFDASGHAMNHTNLNHGRAGFREALVITAMSPVAPQPGERSLHHPASRQQDEAHRAQGPLYQCQGEVAQLRHPRRQAIAAIG